MLKRIDLGYKKFFKRDAKRPPKFKRRMRYASQTFDGKQCPVKEHATAENQGGSPIARVRINGRWYNFWYSREIQGNIKQVTVKKDNVGDFYLSFTTDYTSLEPEPKTGNVLRNGRGDNEVATDIGWRAETPANLSHFRTGFDMGIKTLLTCSNGRKYESPQFYRDGAKKVNREIGISLTKCEAAAIARKQDSIWRELTERLKDKELTTTGNWLWNSCASLIGCSLRT